MKFAVSLLSPHGWTIAGEKYSFIFRSKYKISFDKSSDYKSEL